MTNMEQYRSASAFVAMMYSLNIIDYYETYYYTNKVVIKLGADKVVAQGVLHFMKE